MPKIACIGWGSLIWDKERPFPIIGEWQPDGPWLPVEFVRRSTSDLLTLVITEDAPLSQTCWAYLPVQDLAETIAVLAEREGRPGKPTRETNIGRWPGPASNAAAEQIAAWAVEKQLSGVAWTALPPRWDGQDGCAPTQQQAVEYLRRLPRDKQDKAERYVRRAPASVRTPYREAIERELGWLPQPAE